jgi:hypothetical protein
MRTKFWLECPKGREHSEDLGVYRRIILKRIRKIRSGCGLDSSGSGYGPMARSCENDNEIGPIKGEEFV